MRTILLMSAALLAAAPALAQGAATAQATPFKAGGMEVVALADNIFPAPNDGKVFGADVGPEAVGKLLAAHGLPTDKIVVGIDALLVKSGKRLLLIDTGYGVKAGGALIPSLAKAGYQWRRQGCLPKCHGAHGGGGMDLYAGYGRRQAGGGGDQG
jgi:hypothetical protein